jgi:hypothetical protein
MRHQRKNVGLFLAILAGALFVVTCFLAYRVLREPSTADKPKDQTSADKAFDPEKPDAPPSASETVNLRRSDYTLGALGSLIGAIAAALVGIWLLVGIPNPDEAKQRTEARLQLLSAGGSLGLLLIAMGGIYFYQWSDSLGNWLEKGQVKESLWVAVPLLMVICGSGLVLGAIQPARAEERNNTLIRRLVYGSNLGLTSLLLLVVLIYANVVFSYEVSNKFDTTASGFYSMSPQTEEFLADLDQPILAYAILPGSGSPLETDLRDVLTRFQEASRDKFKVRFISAVTNTSELAALKVDYPPVQDGDLGVLLTFPSDKKRFSFIPIADFFSQEPAGRGESPKTTFVGEGRLVKELLFLADNKQKPKIYFTASDEELQIVGEQDPQRSISNLKDFLEKNYLEIQQLTFDKDRPKVPEDCAVLIVADPQKTFPANQVEAIRKYMTEPLPGGRKGKLVVLSGATLPDQRHRTVVPTGLEGLLAQFNVGLGEKYVFALSADRRIDPTSPPVGFTVEAVKAQNPIARLFRRISILMVLPREVTALTTSPTFTAKALLATDTEGGAWVEAEFPTNINRSVAMADQSGNLRRAVTVGVVVSEGTTARLAVFGDGFIFSNFIARGYAPESPPAFDLLGATIDWLRDRPPVPAGVLSKTYSMYALPNPKTIDTARLRYLPLWLALLGVGGVGIGVWVTRRQQA